MQRLFDDDEKWTDMGLEIDRRAYRFCREIINDFGQDYPLREIAYIIHTSIEACSCEELLMRQCK